MKVAGQALALLEKIESEGGAVDLLAIVNSANASSYHDAVIKYATLALVLSWVVSVVDAYLLGTKKDMEDQGRVRRKETP